MDDRPATVVLCLFVFFFVFPWLLPILGFGICVRNARGEWGGGWLTHLLTTTVTTIATTVLCQYGDSDWPIELTAYAPELFGRLLHAANLSPQDLRRALKPELLLSGEVAWSMSRCVRESGVGGGGRMLRGR